MEDLSPKAGDLEPIETASLDELQSVQLGRMKTSLKRAYDNVPHYKKSFDDAGAVSYTHLTLPTTPYV